MKKAIRNTIIILFYLIGVPYLRFLYLRKKYGPLVRVIVFHEIRDNEITVFENKLKFLKKNFNVISPKQFYNQELSKKKLNILLTFDDGYRSWLKNVIPYLKKYNLLAIFFIPSGFIEAGESSRDFYASRRFNIFVREPLTWKQVRDLDKENFEIGGHTVSHPNLVKLKKEDILKELIQDKEKIEKNLSHKIVSFAYPFGDEKSFNSIVRKETKKSGYQYVFTILPGFNHRRTDRFLMFRDSLNPKMPIVLFKVWLRGGYDLFKKIINYFSNHKFR